MAGIRWIDEQPAQSSGIRWLDEGEQPATPTKPLKIGAEGFADALRAELEGAGWAGRNLAGMGSAVTGVYEGAKQFFGQGDRQAIEANKIIEDAAPIGSIAGNIALTALPFGMAGSSLKAAGAVGAGFGALQPVQGEQTFGNIAQGKLANTAIGGVLSAGGQAVANKAGSMISNKLQGLAAQRAINAQRDATLKAAQDAGFIVPPDVVNPSMLNRALTGFAGKLTTQQQASARNSEVINTMARRALGLADDAPLTDEALAAFRASKSGPYRELSAMGDLPIDDAYSLGKRGPQVFGATKPQSVFLDGAGNVVPDVPPMPKPETQRKLVNEIIESGGITRGEMADMGIDAAAKSRPGLFRKEGTGKTADDLVEWMQDRGWLSARDVELAERNGVGGSHDLARSMVKEAMEGRPVFHPSEDDIAYQFGDKLAKWGEQYGTLQKTTIPGDPGKVNAADAVEKLKDLRFESKAYWNFFNRSGDPKARKAAKAYDGAAAQLEQFLERTASNSGKPELVQSLREARRDIAKAHTVGKALNDATGNINARTLAKEKYLTGELKTAADFAKAFPKAAQPIESMGSLPGISPLDFVSSGILGGAGAMASGDPRGATLAMLPFLRPAARNLILSKAYQGAMANPNYALGAPTQTLGSLLRYSPVGGTVLGLEAFGQ